MTVSVIIPTRGLAPQLATLLTALLHDHTEIVVGVTAADRERVISRVVPISTEIRVVSTPAAGAAAARNAAASAAEGQTLVFVDDDMAVCDGFTDHHRDAVVDEDTVSIGRIHTVERGSWMACAKARWLNEHFCRLDGRPAAPRDLYSGNFALTSRTFWHVGGFDPAWPALHDTVLGLSLAAIGARFVYSRTALTTQCITKPNQEILNDYVAVGRHREEIDRRFGENHGVPNLGHVAAGQDGVLVAGLSQLPDVVWRALAEAAARLAPYDGQVPHLFRAAAVRRGQRQPCSVTESKV